MNKLFILASVLILATGAANAKVTAIADWSDTMPGRTNPPKQDNTTCATKCSGYNLTVAYCYTMGEKLESCPEAGCGYYHRCVPES